MSLMKLDENYINQNYQPTAEELQEELKNHTASINYARMLDGKVAIITGASYGMGYDMARLYAQHGARLIVTARNLKKLENAAEQIRKEIPDADIYAFAADTTDVEKTAELFEFVKKNYGRLDILVNNAAVGGQWRSDTFPDDILDWCTEINLKGPLRYCREALKIMLPQHYGRIVNVSSVNAVRPLCGAVYSSTKGALNTFTISTAIRCVGTGVTCNALCPGFTLTPMGFQTTNNELAPAGQDMVPILRAKSVRNVPVFPMDQANLALFLGSDMSAGLTGQIIVCDNGQYL